MQDALITTLNALTLHRLLASLFALFSWAIAPTGVIVVSIKLFQEIQKVRESQLKILQLEQEVKEYRRIVQPATIEMMLEEQVKADRLLEQRRRAQWSRSQRDVFITLLIAFLAATPIVGLFSYLNDASYKTREQLASQIESVSELRAQLERVQEEQQRLVSLQNEDLSSVEGKLNELRHQLGRVEDEQRSLVASVQSVTASEPKSGSDLRSELRSIWEAMQTELGHLKRTTDLLWRSLSDLINYVDRSRLTPDQNEQLDKLKSELNSAQ